MSRFYVTTPIYYVNDVPHLGTAYTSVVADALRRYHLLRGHDARMLTGTDEHGLKLERAARERGMKPVDFVQQMSDRFEQTWPKLEVCADDFIRTTEARHTGGAQRFWQEIQKRNPEDIYLGDYEGWYCVGCEELKMEKELEQPGNLCPSHKRPVERIKEKSYFFRLSRYERALLQHYEKHPEFVQPPTRRNEVVSFVKSGLRDLSVSRTSFAWGIPVPGDEKHVMYVWFDALTNYWTALQQPSTRQPAQSPSDLRAFWTNQPPEASIVHLVGKDILRFHAVYWPAFLMSAGLELPTTIFAHGWLTYSGQKMSKSLRNAVNPLAVASAFGRYAGREGDAGQAVAGADVLRYQLLRAISFGQDGDFDLAAMVERYNADLSKNLGNLLSRTLGLCIKDTPGETTFAFGGEAPAGSETKRGDLERSLFAECEKELAEVVAAWDRIEPHRALERTWAIASAANQYVDRAAPWAEEKKGNRERVHVILDTLLTILRGLSILIWPAMPSKGDAMRAQLGLEPIETRVGKDWLAGAFEVRGGGETLAGRYPLFPTIDKTMARSLLDELTPRIETSAAAATADTGLQSATGSASASATGPVPAPATTTASATTTATAPVTASVTATASATAVTYDQFTQLDLRVGIVRSCERVPKKDKLLKLAVDLGEPEARTIIAGLALSFQPEQLVGRRVIVVANLAPRDFGKGLVSNGMLLASGPSERLILATVDGDAEAGAKLK